MRVEGKCVPSEESNLEMVLLALVAHDHTTIWSQVNQKTVLIHQLQKKNIFVVNEELLQFFGFNFRIVSKVSPVEWEIGLGREKSVRPSKRKMLVPLLLYYSEFTMSFTSEGH
jgi:hypothetical protein